MTESREKMRAACHAMNKLSGAWLMTGSDITVLVSRVDLDAYSQEDLATLGQAFREWSEILAGASFKFMDVAELIEGRGFGD